MDYNNRVRNETTAFGIPHLKASAMHPMPNDQLAKLIEMHRKSAENAGLYVAVVLAVYLVLLTLLLCRYMKRRPREAGETDNLCSPTIWIRALRNWTWPAGTGSSASSDTKDQQDPLELPSTSQNAEATV